MLDFEVEDNAAEKQLQQQAIRNKEDRLYYSLRL